MSDKEEWSDIETPNEEQKIEIEIEKEEAKEEVQETKTKEGKRDTNAEKRIAQLIRQRRERDQQITALIQKNEELGIWVSIMWWSIFMAYLWPCL